jgi:hypothetical protein
MITPVTEFHELELVDGVIGMIVRGANQSDF